MAELEPERIRDSSGNANWRHESVIELETKVRGTKFPDHSKCSESAEFCSFWQSWACAEVEQSSAYKAFAGNRLVLDPRIPQAGRSVWPSKCNFLASRKEAITQ